jgi:hypothetical protein
MKKKILGGVALLAIAAVAAWNVSLNSQGNELSAVSLANVEALAYELPDVVITCGATEGRCWESDGYDIHYTPFGPFFVTACRFYGYQNVSCYSGLPY